MVYRVEVFWGSTVKQTSQQTHTEAKNLNVTVRKQLSSHQTSNCDQLAFYQSDNVTNHSEMKHGGGKTPG